MILEFPAGSLELASKLLKNSQIISGCFCCVPTSVPTFFSKYVVLKQKGPGNEVAGAFDNLLVDLI